MNAVIVPIQMIVAAARALAMCATVDEFANYREGRLEAFRGFLLQHYPTETVGRRELSAQFAMNIALRLCVSFQEKRIAELRQMVIDLGGVPSC